MKVIILYDSYYGNTEAIARAIGKAFADGKESGIFHINSFALEFNESVDLIIIGSPTRKFQVSPGMAKFIRNIPRTSIDGKKFAAFDTRISVDDLNSGFLRKMIHLFGYAAEPLAKKMQRRGGYMLVEPEGFYVDDTEGPLKEGEEERAFQWAEKIKNML